MTDRVPEPHVAVGVVENDPPSRTLSVRLSELEAGYGRLLYRQAHQALRQAEESAGPHRTVWASAPGSLRVAFAVPGDFGVLLFNFPVGIDAYQERVGIDAYQERLGTPGLAATVVLDRETCRILNVRFRNVSRP